MEVAVTPSRRGIPQPLLWVRSFCVRNIGTFLHEMCIRDRVTTASGAFSATGAFVASATGCTLAAATVVSAFADCRSLENIILPNSLISIGSVSYTHLQEHAFFRAM